MADAQLTKNAIAQALIELCQTKRFDKISIADITNSCHLNRQTLYYHFNDKYDLLEWIYQEQAFNYLSQGITLDNWDVHVLKMLNAIQDNHDFYRNTVNSDPTVLTSCFSRITNLLFLELFERIDLDKVIKEEDKVFYSRFFSYGCGGVLLEWINSGFKELPAVVASQLVRLAKDTEVLAANL